MRNDKGLTQGIAGYSLDQNLYIGSTIPGNRVITFKELTESVATSTAQYVASGIVNIKQNSNTINVLDVIDGAGNVTQVSIDTFYPVASVTVQDNTVNLHWQPKIYNPDNKQWEDTDKINAFDSKIGDLIPTQIAGTDSYNIVDTFNATATNNDIPTAPAIWNFYKTINVALTGGATAPGYFATYTISSCGITFGTFNVYNGTDGKNGINGNDGLTPQIVVANGSDINQVGTPSVTYCLTNASIAETTITFHQLKGEKGDTPVITGQQTAASSTSQGQNIYKFFADGSPLTNTLTVYNGKDGTDGGWYTPASVVQINASKVNLVWTYNKNTNQQVSTTLGDLVPVKEVETDNYNVIDAISSSSTINDIPTAPAIWNFYKAINISLSSGSTSAGCAATYTISGCGLTFGTFNVYNGINGRDGTNGKDGAKGADGITPTIIVVSGTDINQVGTPSVTYCLTNASTAETTITFHKLKGEKGNTPVITGSQTTSSTASQGKNIYTFSADGTSLANKLTVYNGTDGVNGADGGWYTPASNLTTTNSQVSLTWTYSKDSSTKQTILGDLVPAQIAGTDNYNIVDNINNTSTINDVPTAPAIWNFYKAINITQTSGSTTPGSTVTYTLSGCGITFGTFNVYNGTNGRDGATPTITAAKGAHINSVGTPNVTTSTCTATTTTTFTFDYLKGEKGDKGEGVSMRYDSTTHTLTLEIVNS